MLIWRFKSRYFDGQTNSGIFVGPDKWDEALKTLMEGHQEQLGCQSVEIEPFSDFIVLSETTLNVIRSEVI